jgi:hypothetical protein
MTSKKKIRNLIVIGDTHCGDTFAIVPLDKKIYSDHGKIYQPTESQSWLWECWSFFLKEWLPMVTKSEPYSVIHMGDVIEGVHHNAIHQATQNLQYQREWATQLLRPLVDGAKKRGGVFFAVRGTPAHDGEDGQNAEAVASALGAVSRNGMRSHHELEINLNGKYIRAQHHISGSGVFTGRGRNLRVELAEAMIESSLWGGNPPDAIIAGHVHTHDECRIHSLRGYVLAMTSPAWQLKTPFAGRVVGARQTQPKIGAILIRVDDDSDIYARSIIWSLKRPEVMHA